MARRCGPNIRPCGMSQGIYNPFFQNGEPWYGSGGGSGGVAPSEQDALLEMFGDDLLMFIDDSNTSTMFQEIETSAQVTPVTADTNLIGLIYDVSAQSHQIAINAATRRPTLSSDVSRNSFILFDGSNDFLTVKNSKKYFSYFQGSPVGSILFWAKSNGDGTLQAIFSSNNRTTTSNGLYLGKNADNTLNLFISNNSVALVNKSTTATLTIADGWVPIRITFAGAGTNTVTIQIGTKTAETANFTAGTALDMLSDLHIGSRDTTADRAFNGGLSAIAILKRVISAEDWGTYGAYNPERITTEFTPVTDWEFDYNDSTKIFADSAGTTPITDGTAIRLFRNGVTSKVGSLNRDLVSASDTVSPVWREGNLNGKSGAEWDGVDDELTTLWFSENEGKYVEFIVTHNRDATLGSHPWTGYLAVTGSNYVGNPGGVANFIRHTSGGSSISIRQKNVPELTNVFAIRRVGSALSAWNGLKEKATSTNSEIATITIFGRESNAGWWMDGFQYYVKKVNGYMTDAQVEAEIDRLNALYNI